MQNQNNFTNNMKKRSIWIIIVVISITITLITLFYKGTYIGVTGLVCGETASEACYEELHAWGFPIPYVWDNGWFSVLNHMGWEDLDIYKTPLYFSLNVLFYIFVIAIFSRFVLKKKLF